MKYERQLHTTVKKHFEVSMNFLWCGFFSMRDYFAKILDNFNIADKQEVVYSKSSLKYVFGSFPSYLVSHIEGVEEHSNYSQDTWLSFQPVYMLFPQNVSQSLS